MRRGKEGVAGIEEEKEEEMDKKRECGRCADLCMRLTQIEAEDWTHSVSWGTPSQLLGLGGGRAGLWMCVPAR